MVALSGQTATKFGQVPLIVAAAVPSSLINSAPEFVSLVISIDDASFDTTKFMNGTLGYFECGFLYSSMQYIFWHFEIFVNFRDKCILFC